MVAQTIIQAWDSRGQSSVGTPTLATTPTSGDLIIAWLVHDNAGIDINTVGGWLVGAGGVASDGTEGQNNTYLIYRFADGNSNAFPKVISGNFTGTAICIGLDINSVFATWSANLVDLKSHFGNVTNQCDSFTGLSSAGLSILGFSQRDGTIFPGAPSISAGWSANSSDSSLNQQLYVKNKTNGDTAVMSWPTQGITDWIAIVLGVGGGGGGGGGGASNALRAFPEPNTMRQFPVNSGRVFPIT